MHKKEIIYAGKKISEAKKALVMLHGRGASAQDILSIASYLDVEDYALVAPQATNQTWYPYSFMTPSKENEPWLSSALNLVKEIRDDIVRQGISNENIFFLGFSQGACLTLEFVTRNAEKYGGVVAFTGGLIGDRLLPENYKGDFKNTPVFIGSSDTDPHVPVERVQASAEILKKMNAQVVEKIYTNMGHTVNQDEIEQVNKMIFHNRQIKNAG